MELGNWMFNQLQTYLEFGIEQVKLVQIKGTEIVYQQSFKRETENIDFYLKHLPDQPQEITLLIPGVKTFTGTLDLPCEAEERLAEIIKFQFVEQLPCSPEQVYATYYLARQEQERIKVIACAVMKEYIDDLYQSAIESDLKVKSIVPEPLVFYSLYQGLPEDKEQVIYVDGSLEHFQFTFLSADTIYMRSSKTKDIKETLFYLREASKLKADEFNLSPIEESDFIVFNQNRKKDFWFEISQVTEMIADQELIDLSNESKNNEWKKISMLAALIGLIIVVNFSLQWNLKQQKIDNLKRKLSQVKPVVTEINSLDQKIFTTRKKIDQIKMEINLNNNYLPCLEELTTNLGAKVTIKAINLKKDQLVLLSGTAPSASAVMDDLEESSYFKKLKFSGTIETLDNRERFKIVGDLNRGINQ
ncbi:MAG: PilN domain-containing protein [Bacillota bacterium]